ncbi:MarR family winged helix-turn-helix transcriptional regulator [Paramicrobacterium sp. CJ85]|uniref:MarR family winged helix-turn-helix transcriptional regulator n=1 Tax=Paramicrobacterium sp. CJ85 TaxID=3445355 RepID=UPI003F5F4CC4
MGQDSIDGGRRVAAQLTRLDRLRHTHEHRGELGTAGLRILWLFSDRHPRTLADVASALHLEQSTVNRQVNAVAAAGLLVRERSEEGRPYLYSPTEEGIVVFERAVAVSVGAYDAALAALGPDDADSFISALERFVDAYSRSINSDT